MCSCAKQNWFVIHASLKNYEYTAYKNGLICHHFYEYVVQIELNI